MKAKTLDEHIETAIEGQNQLNRETVQLSDEWSQLTPQEMAERCEKLNQLREDISKSDKDLLEILQLAGIESTQHPRLERYKSLLKDTMSVYDEISVKAQNHKTMLTNEISRLKKSRVGLSGYSTQTNKSGNIVKENG